FRLHLVPKVGPKAEADLALTFIREDAIEAEQLELLAGLSRGTVIVREQVRGVANLNLMKPNVVVAYIDANTPFKFHMGHFVAAWKDMGVRPATGSSRPERTTEQYCVYDAMHDDYA